MQHGRKAAVQLVGMLKGGTLTVQVNSFGSLAQAVVVLLLLPGLAALRGINPTELPQYLTEGNTASLVLFYHAGVSCPWPMTEFCSPMVVWTSSLCQLFQGVPWPTARVINMCCCSTAGFQCLTGTTPACASTDCSKAPVVALAYVACNLGLNISALALLRKAGAGMQSSREVYHRHTMPCCLAQASPVKGFSMG